MSKAARIALGLALLLLVSGCAPRNDRLARGNGSVYSFGEVVVCETDATVRFNAVVRQEQGRVQHLLALNGYQWLEEKSALLATASLADLQKGFAVLDWKLWDELWQGIDSQTAYAVRVYVAYAGRTLPAHTLVHAQDLLHVGDLMFLGCPYFDAVALSASAAVDCSLCPVFPLEQEALGKRFVRGSGESGFTINTHSMFPLGSRVEVIIRLP